jgi:UDP-4-amino-4-deoxy-L-arabinose-oxoglutarate aminotransferase
LGYPLIEDCCQHLGENYQSVDQNHRGILSVFSFHATKCLTTGEGGAVATNNTHLAKRIEAACQQVPPQISDLQASLGLSQLARYPDMLEIRRQIANHYLQTISKHSLEDTYRIAHRTMWFRFPLLLKSQNFVDVQASFESSGISVRRGIDRLLHRSLNQSDQMFPNAAKLYEKTLSIPIYPALDRAQQDQIINATNNILSMTT